MKRLLYVVVAAACAAGAGSLAPASRAAAPSITSLSVASAPRSGRVVITGAGFGASKGSSVVTIGGLTAWTTRWSDTSISAFVPEGAAIGSDDVSVTVGGAFSNHVALTVQTRQANGRVRWRFQVDGQYVNMRPAVGPDGGIAVCDSLGSLYSLTAAGALRWVVTGACGSGPPSIGADGTVYGGNGSTVTAVAPDGSVRWRFTEPTQGQGFMAGPTVGPDGNIYVISDWGGLGAFALSPAGKLLWNNRGNPQFQEYAQIGVEVVFGSGQLYGAFDEFTQAPQEKLFGLTLGGSQRFAVTAGGGAADEFMQQQTQPAVAPDGTVYVTATGGENGWALYSYNPSNGAVNWLYSPYPSNGMSPPDVAPDGTVVFSRSLDYLEAVTPSGRSKWVVDNGAIADTPIVSPDGSLVAIGTRHFGEPGSVRGRSAADGSLVWQVDLGVENGGNQILYSRPRFSGDSRTVYFGTAVLGGNTQNEYSYLYAVDATRAGAVPTAATVRSFTVKRPRPALSRRSARVGG